MLHGFFHFYPANPDCIAKDFKKVRGKCGSGLASPIRCKEVLQNQQAFSLRSSFVIPSYSLKQVLLAVRNNKAPFACAKEACCLEVGSGFEPPYEVLQTSA